MLMKKLAVCTCMVCVALHLVYIQWSCGYACGWGKIQYVSHETLSSLQKQNSAMNTVSQTLLVQGKRSDLLPFAITLTQRASGVGIIVGSSYNGMACVRFLVSFGSAAADGTLRLVHSSYSNMLQHTIFSHIVQSARCATGGERHFSCGQTRKFCSLSAAKDSSYREGDHYSHGSNTRCHNISSSQSATFLLRHKVCVSLQDMLPVCTIKL